MYFRVLLCVLLFSHGASAQWRGMQFEHFDAHDGLNSGFITAICQDSVGFLYFAGYQQLIRYDGHIFEDFTHDPTDSTSIGPGQITNMLVTADGKIWLAMRRDGLNVYDPKTETFQRFAAPVADNSILQLLEDDAGILWTGTAESSLLSFDRKTNQFTTHPFANDIPAYLDNVVITGLVQDQTDPNTIWLSIYDYSDGTVASNIPYQMARFDKSTSKLSLEACKGIVKSQDSQGRLWGGSWVHGLWCYDPKTKSCENIRFSVPLPSGKIATDGVFEIKHFVAETWVGSRNSVLSFSKDLDYQFITKREQYGDVNAIEKDRAGNIWIGTTNGLEVTHPGSQHIDYYALAELGTQERVYPGRLAYNPKDQTIYLINRNEPHIYKIPLDQKIKPSIINASGALSGICVDSKNRILVASQSALYQLNPDQQRLKKISIHDSFDYSIPWLWSMESRDNGLVAGIAPNDFFWFDDEHSLRHLNNPEKKTYTGNYTRLFFTDDDHAILSGGSEIHEVDLNTGADRILRGPSNEHVIKDEEGMYWLGTISTIGRYQLIGDSLHIMKYYTASDGLINITATHLHLDYKNRIWIFSNGGLSVIDPVLNETRNIGVPEGLPVNNNDPVQVLNLDDGRMCTVNDNGLIVFHPDSLWSATSRPDVPVVLKDLRIEGMQDVDLKNVNFRERISLSPNQNTLDIQFQGLAFPNDRLVTYSYKVDGLHDHWIYLGKNNSVTLSRIPPGKYIFHVKTGAPEALSPVKSLAFHIGTPLYMRPWFLLVGLALLVFCLYQFYRTRIRKIKKQAEEKTRINQQMAELELKALRSQMNPHFMFNSLNSIKNYILKNETTKASEYLSNFSHLIRMILQNSREKTVSLKDELDTLLLYIDLEKLRFRDGFEFTCQIDDSIDISQIQIPPMIIQPFIENAIWHGLLHKESDRHLALRIHRKNGNVICEVEDDGIGRQSAAEIKSKSATQYKSMGMGITQDRITLLNSMSAMGIEMEIIDKMDNHQQSTGTLVKIKIPYASHTY